MTKPKKLNKNQERRLKELDGLQQTLQGNLELEKVRVRQEAEEYQNSQKRTITDKVMPIDEAYKKARKDTEKARDAAIREANKAYEEAESDARAVKREALALVEEEIHNLEVEVEKRIAAGDAAAEKDFNEKLRAIVKERQEIRGGDEPKVPDVPSAEAVPAFGAEESGGEAVEVPTVS